MWALLPVVPPQPYRNDTYAVDAVVLQAFTTNATYRAHYLAWGMSATLARLATGKSTEYNDGGVAHADAVSLSDGQVSYMVRTTVQPGPGAFDATTYRYWLPNGTAAGGWIEAKATPSTTLGAGTATYQSQGDEGAPPVSAGTAHRVEGVGMTLTWHALP